MRIRATKSIEKMKQKTANAYHPIYVTIIYILYRPTSPLVTFLSFWNRLDGFQFQTLYLRQKKSLDRKARKEGEEPKH